MRVLLVDGDGAAADAIQTRLEAIESWNVEVIHASGLDAALERARGEPVDVALVDLDLQEPGSDQPVARFRETFPQLPVIGLASLEGRRAGVEAIRQGAEDLLLRDRLSTESLARAIRHAIERRATSLALERSNLAFEAFAHTVAHEIRSPLSTVSFACELLRLQPLDEAGTRQVDRIRKAVVEADGIIEGLLEYASATREAPAEVVDLKALAAEVAESLPPEIDPSVVEIGDLPEVRGVRSQLRLVMQNLLRNAVAYADPEGPVIHVDAEHTGRAWEIRVQDNGAGMPAEDCERAFEMFRRGSQARGNGSGLGLAICRRVIEGLGGRIEADAGSLGGCRVRFTVPDESVDLDAYPPA